MTTFLQLCIDAGRDSGLISSNNRLVTVTSATGKQEKIVNFVRQAFEQIQRARTDWPWMVKEYAGSTVAGQGRYTATGFSIVRFSAFACDLPALEYRPHALYDPAIGASNTTELEQVDYPFWRANFGRGTADPGRPIYYALSPAGELCLGPVPDKVYTLSGEYRASPHILAADSDVPDMPASYHDLIKWKAIMLVDSHDGALADYQGAQANYAPLFRALVNETAGALSMGGPLA